MTTAQNKMDVIGRRKIVKSKPITVAVMMLIVCIQSEVDSSSFTSPFFSSAAV